MKKSSENWKEKAQLRNKAQYYNQKYLRLAKEDAEKFLPKNTDDIEDGTRYFNSSGHQISIKSKGELDLAQLRKHKADIYDENSESELEYGYFHDSEIELVFATFVTYKYPDYSLIDESQTLSNFSKNVCVNDENLWGVWVKEYCISGQEFIHVVLGGWSDKDVVPSEEWLQETWDESIVLEEDENAIAKSKESISNEAI